MFRLGALLVVLSCSASAQFFGLATPADGSRIYFATPLRQKNTGQPVWGKVFRADSSGLHIHESREYQVPEPPPIGIATGPNLAHPTNAYSLESVSISSDGQVLATGARRACVSGGSYCSKMENYFTTVTAAGKSAEYPGALRLSANGEWAFGGSSHPSHDDFPYFGYLVNLKTGDQITVSANLGSTFDVTLSGRAVANDGTSVFSLDSAVVVLRSSSMLRIPAQNGGKPVGAVIDPSGQTVVYAVCPSLFPGSVSCSVPGAVTLYAADAVTGATRLLASDGIAPVLSDDGRTVLYISTGTGTPQLRLLQIDGSGDRQLTTDPVGIARAVLSSDASTVYAVTLGGRLIKIAVATGAVQEVVPRTPSFGPLPLFAPGKITSIEGVGLADSFTSTLPPLPDRLDGVTVTIQGKTAKILSVGPTAITVLGPLDLTAVSEPAGTDRVNIQISSSSPFELPANPSLYVSPFAPEFLFADRSPRFPILAAHQDWSGLVTPERPARPGEILHAYAVGLGATSPAVGYGDAAPSQEPLARVSSPFRCMNRGDPAVAVEVLFQGLAPGLAGFYQIDWRVPEQAADGYFPLLCTSPAGSAMNGLVLVRR